MRYLTKNKYISVICLVLISISMSACEENRHDYIEIEALQFFYEAKVQDDNKLKLVLFKNSIPAMFHYKNENSRTFNLSPGDTAEIFIDEQKTGIYMFRYIKYSDNTIFGEEDLLINGESLGSTKIKFKDYPKLVIP